MSVGKIHCCLCGVLVDPNDAAMCLDCLRLQTDISGGIATKGTLIQCGKCDRWMIRQDQWQRHRMESNELLGVCLRKIPGLTRDNTKILDAGFIWTEPHSMRIKVFANIQRGVLDDKVQIKQKIEVEFTIRHKQCLECIREATDHSWGALIQIRQHVGHKKSFYQLEKLLGDAGLHNLMVNIQVVREGIDFYFKTRDQAYKVVDFIQCNMPTKVKLSKKLVSQDKQSNTTKHEYTIHMEVIPLCKGDLVITAKEYTGSQEPMIVTKLTSSIHLLNPYTMKGYELTGTKYFAKPIPVIMTSKQLITFVVLDIKVVNEIRGEAQNRDKLKSIKELGGLLAEATVARESDLGENDNSYVTFTHLGHVLQPGDLVLGYDIQHSVLTAEAQSNVDKLHFDLPDVLLIRKSYPETTKARKRNKNKPSWMKNTSNGDGSGKGRGSKKSTKEGGDEDEKVEFLRQIEDENAFLEEQLQLFPNLQLNDVPVPPNQNQIESQQVRFADDSLSQKDPDDKHTSSLLPPQPPSTTTSSGVTLHLTAEELALLNEGAAVGTLEGDDILVGYDDLDEDVDGEEENDEEEEDDSANDDDEESWEEITENEVQSAEDK